MTHLRCFHCATVAQEDVDAFAVLPKRTLTHSLFLVQLLPKRTFICDAFAVSIVQLLPKRTFICDAQEDVHRCFHCATVAQEDVHL